MASVSSLDKDLRHLRLDKYTPGRANEVRKWIDETLGERLPPGDLLDALKDGTALCKLVNVAVPGAVRFKTSAMPFVQMENISHFLRACQAPPLSMPAHDCFLTVDLYEAKDPAQVLQCIEAFSRVASGVAPQQIPKPVGNLKTVLSPDRTGGSAAGGHGRTGSNVGTPVSGRASPVKSGRLSPMKSGGPLSPAGASSWANKSDMGETAPAWNIAQYGWTGGASQGNQGIMFGGRRQITTAQPHVPSVAEKEKRRQEKEEADARARLEAEEAERQRRAADELRAQQEEEQRWADETRKLKEQEMRAAAAEKQRWEEEQRRWRLEEEKQAREEKEVEARLEAERQRKAGGEQRLQGQFLSQYRAEQKQTSEADRIRELERQLEEAKERERQYERERRERGGSSLPAAGSGSLGQPSAGSVEATPEPELEENSIQDSERDFLVGECSAHQALQSQSPRPLPTPTPTKAPVVSASPSPSAAAAAAAAKAPPPPPPAASAPFRAVPASTRPLPNPATYVPSSSLQPPNRPERVPVPQQSAPAPIPPPAAPAVVAAPHVPVEAAFNSRAEADAEAARRQAGQARTAAGGRAASSLLEREMERERQRQREWEEGQQATQAAVAAGRVDADAGVGPGQSWDVHQYGYTGGDNMNKGTGGVYMGRRQILGPRPLGSKGGG